MFNRVLLVLSGAGFLFFPLFGAASVSLGNILDPSTVDYRIFWELRMPRSALAFFTGAALGLSGLLFQTLFRNPLTTPFTLGVASGATLGAAVAIKLGLVVTFFAVSSVALFGFLGAVATIVILFVFARRLHSFGNESLLLLGIALSFFYSAVIYILYYLSSFMETHAIVRFTMGSLSIAGISELLPVALATLGLLLVALFYSRELQLLAVSASNAYLKGIDIKRVNYVILLAVSVVIGIVVSVTGPIGFIGLIIPHLIRKMSRQNVAGLIVPVFLGGGFFLQLCDLLARSLAMPSEIPIGIITSFLGGPFFIYLILSRRS